MSYPSYGQPYGQPPPPSGYGNFAPHQQGHYPPSQGQPFPQQGHSYPPQQGQGYPPQQGHNYPPQQGQNYPPQGGHFQQPPYGQGPPPPPHYQPYGHHSPAPPPPHQGQYGAPQPPPLGAPYHPPAQQWGPQSLRPPVPPTPPSLGYGAPQIIQWDATADAQALRGAMKGFGTDEKTLIHVLSNKDALQIDMIRNTFDRSFNRNLIKDLKSETSSWFEKGLVQLARGPLLADVHGLYDAMAGPGTKEVVLNDILLGRSNADIKAIKSAYHQTFRKSLEDTIKGDLSMKTERHFLMVLAANRAEDAAPVVVHEVEDDVMNLYKATEGRMGTDEILVCSILTSRNDNHIRTVAHEYKRKFNRDLEKVIESVSLDDAAEFSGHMKSALLFQLRHAVDRYMQAATLLEESMAGMGTKDHLLVSRVVRFHWDRTTLANVKGAYQHKYGKSLASRIRGETSGDYRNLMLACVGD